MGPSGSGQLAKMANQIAVAGVVQSLLEAIHFAECAGLDIESIDRDDLERGCPILADGKSLEDHARTRVRLRLRSGLDAQGLGICLEEAASNGADLPATRLIDDFYAEIQARGGNRWDTSSLIARLGRESND